MAMYAILKKGNIIMNMNKRYDSDKAIKSIINATGNTPRKRNIVGRLLSKVHNIHDHELMSSVLATSAERIAEPVIYEVYYTKGHKRFDSLTMAKASTRRGRVYHTLVTSDGSKIRKEMK